MQTPESLQSQYYPIAENLYGRACLFHANLHLLTQDLTGANPITDFIGPQGSKIPEAALSVFTGLAVGAGLHIAFQSLLYKDPDDAAAKFLKNNTHIKDTNLRNQKATQVQHDTMRTNEIKNWITGFAGLAVAGFVTYYARHNLFK